MNESSGMQGFGASDYVATVAQQHQVAVGTPPPQPSVPALHGDVTSVLARAGVLGALPARGTTSPRERAATFHTVFLALMLGDEPGGRWIREAATALRIELPAILARWAATGGAELDAAALERLRAAHPTEAFSVTGSMSTVLAAATEIAQSAAEAVVDLDHLIAAYAYTRIHEDDLAAWGVARRPLAARVIARAARRFPQRLGRLLQLHRETLPNQAGPFAAHALEWAAALAAQRDAATITAEDLLGGMLISGTGPGGGGRTAPWLLTIVGTDLPQLLGREPPASRVPLQGNIASAFATRPDGRTLTELAPDDEAARALQHTAVFSAANDEVHVMHLLVGLLASGATTADRIWARAGIDRESVLSLLWDHVAETEPLDIAHWREVYERPGETVRRAGFTNDEARGDDRLGFDRAARAMAAVISAADSAPPMSIGVFGDWGSGKSFFMNLVKSYVDERARTTREARERNEPSAYVGEVIQIDFNAWQFMDSNLWASLATHLFDQLNDALTADNKPSADRYVKELASVRAEISDLEAEQTQLVAKITALDTELAQNAAARAAKTPPPGQQLGAAWKAVAEDPEIQKAIATATKALGLENGGLALQDLEREARQLYRLGGRLAVWWRAVAGPVTRVLTLAVVGLTIAIPIVARLSDHLAFLAAWIVPLASFATLLARLRGNIQPIADEIDATLAKAGGMLADEQSRRTEAETQLATEREQLAATAAHLAAQKKALIDAVTELETKLQALKDGKSFVRFVLERAASDDYRKQQGIISMVHRDMCELAARLSHRAEQPYVERIILYIDDLDRCAPPRVVEVLQAIHLLLSLPLFVVIVAVDSRWLLDSLEAYYERQFGQHSRNRDEWEGTPQRYLEKIFQIPFAIPAMTNEGFGALVNALLQIDPGTAPGAVTSSTPPPPPAVDGALPVPAVPAPHGTAPVVAMQRDGFHPAFPRAADHDGNPLLLTLEEREHFKTLAPLVPTPRSAKRLMNLYRFARASLSPALFSQVTTGGFRLVQVLMAVIVGNPAAARAVIDAILANHGDGPMIRALVASRAEHDPYWKLIDTACNAIDLSSAPRNVAIAMLAARFGFNGRAPRRASAPATA